MANLAVGCRMGSRGRNVTRDRSDPPEMVERDREIAAVRERLARLESEKAELRADLNRLLSAPETRKSLPPAGDPPVTNASSPATKIALFRSLFRGRDDVFPKRWENTKTGKAGYAPACANEWTPRICDKPRVKCGECLPGAGQRPPLLDRCPSVSRPCWPTRSIFSVKDSRRARQSARPARCLSKPDVLQRPSYAAFDVRDSARCRMR
jgi:hypothetical protein